MTACRGRHRTPYPYGARFDRHACNLFNGLHPAHLLHGDASIGHGDPRLNLVLFDGEAPLLSLTGVTPRCKSPWSEGDGVYDMAGNLDEWVEAARPTFRGGFYARGSRRGCDARVTSHAASYHDYSIGARCCKDAR